MCLPFCPSATEEGEREKINIQIVFLEVSTHSGNYYEHTIMKSIHPNYHWAEREEKARIFKGIS